MFTHKLTSKTPQAGGKVNHLFSYIEIFFEKKQTFSTRNDRRELSSNRNVNNIYFNAAKFKKKKNKIIIIMHYQCFILKNILILWAINMLVMQSRGSCWDNENECNINTELFKNIEYTNGISMQIDCRLQLENSGQDQATTRNDEMDFQIPTNNLVSPRFKGVQSVLLDGCQTPLNAHTFGLELLPICANITQLAIRHFNMETLKALECGKEVPEIQLEYLKIQSNEITFIAAGSFSSSNTNLRNILLERNSLKIIYGDVFKGLHSLENLFIVNEPMLMLKFSDLFENSSFLNIHLDTLKQMMSHIFNHLPETLQNLYVANTQLDGDTVIVRNSLALQNLTIRNCALRNFTLQDVHSTVKHIDLSGNVMETFAAHEPNHIKELNLRNNQLESLPLQWLDNLTHLEFFILKGNRLKTLSLNNLLKAVPHGELLDLSQNYLKQFQDYENNMPDAQLSQIRLVCDQNPWDCLWLHEFAHYHPEKFRIFRYEKYISKINVNGLECRPAEKPKKPADNRSKPGSTLTVDSILNVSTFTLMYGSPWEIKRNQRAEALIIVFMLPLGIALLFVLLYMWIYCQKMFHMSYYQNFPCMRRSDNRTPQHFDIIRQMPPRPNQHPDGRRPLTRIIDENEEGYEIPINGIISECNCIMKQTDDTDQCQKSVHITYEQLPNEAPPHRIYEEILQLDCPRQSAADKTKQTYDHLAFD